MYNRCSTLKKRTNLWDWVVVDVNDLVQVLDNNFGDRCQFVKVIGLVWGDIHVESNGCQVTHCNLIGRKNR